jgi:glycosyltransferase involved in cell wall biosynthesis
MNPVASRRVLLVSTSFTPAMPASVHRSRHLAWTLPAAGWECVILTSPKSLQRPEWVDEQGASFFPSGIEVREAEESRGRMFSRLGGGISWRAFEPLRQAGNRLLAERRFDVVYISTTQFNLFCLGRLWKSRFGTPYVLDFHDPWYRPGERITTGGARWKSALGNFLARYMERYALAGAAGVVSVSSDYLRVLRERYPRASGLAEARGVTMPFAVREEDFALISPADEANAMSRTLEVGYVGVGAEIMAKSFREIADSMKRLRRKRDPLVDRLRVRLFGTDGRWCQGRAKILHEVAVAAGVGDLVEEQPAIVPYREALGRAARADGLLVLGVDDPAYMPSKLFLYASTGKPLLASMRHDSQVNTYFAKYADLGRLMSFGSAVSTEERNDEALRLFLQDLAEKKTFSRAEVRRDFSAARMAEQHAELFERIVPHAAAPR